MKTWFKICNKSLHSQLHELCIVVEFSCDCVGVCTFILGKPQQLELGYLLVKFGQFWALAALLSRWRW